MCLVLGLERNWIANHAFENLPPLCKSIDVRIKFTTETQGPRNNLLGVKYPCFLLIFVRCFSQQGEVDLSPAAPKWSLLQKSLEFELSTGCRNFEVNLACTCNSQEKQYAEGHDYQCELSQIKYPFHQGFLHSRKKVIVGINN